jgi:hypothetical protein
MVIRNTISPNKNEKINQIFDHIKKLINLSKKLSLIENIEKLEEKSLKWINRDFGRKYWRGGDIQVVKCFPDSSYEEFAKSVTKAHYSRDEPCPSRYPELMTGLINEIQKDAYYLDATNKYEFYGKIAESAQILELNNLNLEKQLICKEIILNQIRFILSWIYIYE